MKKKNEQEAGTRISFRTVSYVPQIKNEIDCKLKTKVLLFFPTHSLSVPFWSANKKNVL